VRCHQNHSTQRVFDAKYVDYAQLDTSITLMRKYRLVAKKGEGTFSEVLKAQNVRDGKYHAIKCMKNKFDSIDQVKN
jgi:serine/threonine protein kinase